MPKKKAVKKTVRKASMAARPKQDMILKNQFFGMLLIAIAAGALVVFVRYLIITLSAPADIYLVEPAQLIPGLSR